MAFLFASFYATVQFMAAGVLFHWTTGVPVAVGAIALDSIQCILLIAGIITLGYFTLNAVGGWQVMSKGIVLDARFANVPGIIDWTVGERKCTGIFILTYLFALMGIQASPAFTLWAFSNRNSRTFAWQQFFMSTVVVGIALVKDALSVIPGLQKLASSQFGEFWRQYLPFLKLHQHEEGHCRSSHE